MGSHSKQAICEPKLMMTVVEGLSIVFIFIYSNIPRVNIDGNIPGVNKIW